MAQWLPPHQRRTMGPELPPNCQSATDQPLHLSPLAPGAPATGMDDGTGRQIASWRPYVWQDGEHVLILEVEPVGWVVAELRFDPCTCQYVEAHRAIYHWAREAFGAFLARAMDPDEMLMTALANELSIWAAKRFGPPAPLQAN